jgi:hypothetical protein
MPVDFFESELEKVRIRFNETYCRMTVCNIKTRQSVMLAIVSMGLLHNKISGAHSRDEVRPDIRKFVRTRNTLNNLFNQIRKEKSYVERTEQRKIIADSKAVSN